MTYTLAMAEALEIRIAADGVQEVPLTLARAYLTRLIEQAREDGLISALTVRLRRRVYVVTPAFYDQAAEDRLTVEAIGRLIDEMPNEKARNSLAADLHRYRQELTSPPA